MVTIAIIAVLLLLQVLGLWAALGLVRFAKSHPAGRERLPAPPKVPHDMAVLDHTLRRLDRAGW